ncbi:beta strand repeat-containing protein [Kiritimatiella glycovorans]|uniref:Autotransporter-associated beta strand repeat n=1 Tax=Kiritimatiella glycovorans TaxID=1307763 RepID=A0A0G3EH79_9BACT|nr:autotransporter-associated beta strand repeat-containing protein [Kiritimatiella glycovorans]AKJ63499.1 autotransporter-associated beta strand repeat [Kiritimatiella glycovorans]
MKAAKSMIALIACAVIIGTAATAGAVTYTNEAWPDSPVFWSSNSVWKGGNVAQAGTNTVVIIENGRATSYHDLADPFELNSLVMNGTQGHTIHSNSFRFSRGSAQASIENDTSDLFIIESDVELNDAGGVVVGGTGSGDIRLKGVVSGGANDGGIIADYGGQVSLSQAATYTGDTVVRRGTFSFGSGVDGTQMTQGSDFILGEDGSSANATLETARGSGVFADTQTVTVKGEGHNVITSANGLNGDTSYDADIVLDNADLEIRIWQASGHRNLNLDGGISGTGDLVLNADPRGGTAGNINVAGANTYAGDTYIGTNGIAMEAYIRNGSAIPDTSDVYVEGLASMRIYANETIGALNGEDSGAKAGARFGGDTLTVGANDADGSFAGQLYDDVGTLNFVKTGSGRQTLTGTNTYTGTTTVNEGILQFNREDAVATDVNLNSSEAAVVASGWGTSNLLTHIDGGSSAGAVLIPGDNNETLDMGSLNISLGSDGAHTYGGDISVDSNGVYRFTGAFGDLNVASDLDGYASVLVTGGGSVTLSGTNTYTPPGVGNIQVQDDSILVLGSEQAVSDAGGRVFINGSSGGTVDLNGKTLSRDIVFDPSGTSAAYLTNASATTATMNGQIRADGDADDNNYIGGSAGDIVLNNQVQESFIKAGSNTVEIDGINNTAPEITVQQGTLKLTRSLSNWSATDFTLDGGTFNPSFGHELSIYSNSTITAASESTIQVDGISTINGTLTGSANLTKTGGSELRFGAENSGFTGNLTLADGNLMLNTNLANAAVTVQDGARLAGSASVGGQITVETGGFLRPGISPGILTAEDGLTMQDGTYTEWELIDNTESGRGTNFDGIDVTGGDMQLDGELRLILNSTESTVDFDDTFWTDDTQHVWTVASYTGAGTSEGNFDNVDVYYDGSVLGDFTTERNGDNVDLVWTIPEPAAFTMLILGLAVFRLRRVVKRS